MIKKYFFFPINSLLPFLVLGAFVMDRRHVSIPVPILVAMAMVGLGLLLGVLAGEPLWKNTKTFVTAVCGFVIGYKAIVGANNLRSFINLLSWMGLLYAVVCLLAVLGVNKTLFPVSYLEGFDNGVLVRRAEITTDQNVQIYYLFPLMMIFALKQNILKNICFALLTLGAIYTAIKMETRSGLLLLVVGFAMFSLLPVWYKERRGILRLASFTVVAVMALILNLSLLNDSVDVVARRFQVDNLGTLWGRIYSALFLYERVWNPLWWIPKGLKTFSDLHGVFPHHAPTFIFLQAGIFGLAGWFILIALPIFRSIKLIFKKRFDITEATIMVGSLISFVACLSLAAAMFEQLWLWSGAAHGVLIHYRRRSNFQNR